jgi:hypothetical protein
MLNSPKPVWVSVSVSRSKVRISSSTNPRSHALSLGCKLAFAMPVVNEAAKDVVAEAKRLLGDQFCTAEQAAEALRQAYHTIERYRHVDPALSPEQAQEKRKAMILSQ